MKQVLVFVLALLGAALFALGNVLEHRVASRAPDENHLRANLLLYLVRRRVWLIGMAADVSGYLLQATALGLGSLLIVAPLSATGLLFSLGLGAALDGRRLSRRDWIASCTLVAGLVVAAIPRTSRRGSLPVSCYSR
jgi:drug/metabolite transporter (DMT)-like permease